MITSHHLAVPEFERRQVLDTHKKTVGLCSCGGNIRQIWLEDVSWHNLSKKAKRLIVGAVGAPTSLEQYALFALDIFVFMTRQEHEVLVHS